MALHTDINSEGAAEDLAVSLGATHTYTTYMNEVDALNEVRLEAYPWSTCFMREASTPEEGYIEVGYYMYATGIFNEIERPIPLSYFEQFNAYRATHNHLTCSDISEVA